MGLLQTALWGGVAVGPLIGGVLADTLGFHAPFIFTSALLLLAGVAVWWGVDEGFTPASAHLDERVGFIKEWRHVLATPGVSLTYTLEFLTGLGRFMIVPILPLFMQSLLPPDAAVSTVTGLAVGASSATATLGAVLLGRLGDQVGHRRIVVVCALAGALIYIPQVFVTQAWQILVLQALGGFAIGGLVAAPSALLARYTQPGEEGAVYGIDNSVVSGSRAVAPLMGAGIAAVLGYRGTFAATALLMLGVAILALRCLPRLMPEARLKVL
jgi:DHA1 family multidrug resistance protein-like MFS transporter